MSSSPSTLSLQARKKSSIRQPREIGAYSINSNDTVVMDRSQLGHFYLPDYFLEVRKHDLNSGYDTFIAKDENKLTHLDTLLTALVQIEKQSGSKINANIVTWRGIMRKLMCLCYDTRNELQFNIIRFDEQLFIEEVSPKQEMDARGKAMSYWGYKFETLATLPKSFQESTREEIESRNNKVVNNIEQFCSIVQTGVSGRKIVLGGEVDCVYDYDDKSEPLNHYCELKTSKVVETKRDAQLFEKKLLATWAQSFLLGVKHVVYGFRDNEGVVRALEYYEAAKIPDFIKESTSTTKEDKWRGNDAIAFYAAVVDWIDATVVQEGEVYRLSFKPGNQFASLAPLEAGLAAEAKRTILTKEFTDWRKELRDKSI